MGRRDYAVLLLLVTYGLRSREIAALTLDDLDWEEERLRVPRTQGGTLGGMSIVTGGGRSSVGYLKDGRLRTADRRLFFRGMAPWRPLSV